MRLDLMIRKSPTSGTAEIAVWKYLLTIIHKTTVQGYDENLLLFKRRPHVLQRRPNRPGPTDNTLIVSALQAVDLSSLETPPIPQHSMLRSSANRLDAPLVGQTPPIFGHASRYCHRF